MDDERFDRAIEQMRDESAAPDRIEGARERVWQRLQGAGALACDQLRPTLEDYAHGRLPEGRRLLVKDHLGRCLDCRHALAEVEGRGDHGRVMSFPERRRWVGWAMAAAVVLAVAFLGWQGLDTALAPSGSRATVASVSGTLLELSEGALEIGAELADGDVVRTGSGSRAVLRLADGSLLEMNGRTELALQGARSGDTVRLQRGDVVVRAAEQGDRRLRVVTRDSVATVRGTVFAVSAATAGSLVSVVEGEVAVTQPGFDRLLGAGQQAASNPALASVSVVQAVSWSENAEDYYRLLADLGEVEQQIAALTGAALRHDPRLLPYLPADTNGYIAIPNVDGAVGEALRLVEQRALPGSVLGDWLSSEEGRRAWRAMEGVESVASMLREEIAVVLTGDWDGPPLLMAEIRDGREGAIGDALDSLAAETGEPIPHIVDGSLLLVSGSEEDLARLAAGLGAGAGSGFAMDVGARYREGVAWLAAIDVSALPLQLADSPEGADLARALGLSNVRHLVVEQKSTSLGDQSLATVSFEGGRRGVASWLGSPGPLGSAEYVSSEALLVASASTREPGEALDQLLRQLGSDNELVAAIEEMERETGIRLRDDVAASLGTDFTFAIERVSVPPGWVAVMEVVDPVALDQTMRRFADAVTRDPDDPAILEMTTETVNGRTWRTLSSPNDDFPGLEWTYHLGYLLAAADRSLALEAIAVRDTGSSLVHSGAFERSFPADAGLHSSGFVWLDPRLLIQLGAMMENLDADWMEESGSDEPLLALVTGESDRLLTVTRSRLTGVMLDLWLGAFASGLAD